MYSLLVCAENYNGSVSFIRVCRCHNVSKEMHKHIIQRSCTCGLTLSEGGFFGAQADDGDDGREVNCEAMLFALFSGDEMEVVANELTDDEVDGDDEMVVEEDGGSNKFISED